MLPDVKFIRGLPDIDEFNENLNNLLILDDLMSEFGKNDVIKQLFTIDSNHKNLIVFFLTQKYVLK